MELSTLLTGVFRLTDPQKTALRKLQLLTVRDLLLHFPFRYDQAGQETTVAGLVAGTEATIVGSLEKMETKRLWKSRVPATQGYVRDATGRIKVTWFNQPYIAKMWMDGTLVRATGKVTGSAGKLYLANPELQKVQLSESGLFENKESRIQNDVEQQLIAIYPESSGITSLWIRHALKKMLDENILEQFKDPISEDLLKRYNLPTLKTALVWVHTPRDNKDAVAAKKRFAFEEIFFIQLARQQERKRATHEKSFVVNTPPEAIGEFLESFGFPLTAAQQRAIDLILNDMHKGAPMSRLLEGDVGSGKTAVAATACFAAVSTRPENQSFGTLQAAYMAPTEILAKQHFESFTKLFAAYRLPIGLITSSGCMKFPSKVRSEAATTVSRAQLLKWVASGEISILIGTHALIEKSVVFKHLALVIIDEQHRFGVRQRKALARGRDAEPTRNDAEKIDPLLYRDLTYRVRNCLFTVKNELGGGHKEVVYQRALAEEFEQAGLKFSREVRIPIKYRSKEVGIYVPDFVIEDKIIIELKALSFVGNTEKKQIWGYLKGSSYHLALLVNFGPRELTIDRVVYDNARSSTSASVPHSSASDPHLSSIPHLLSMTATPIPRTLALTIYGDLDLTLLDEMPPGRKPVITEVVAPEKRKVAYEKIREQLQAGRQAYIICPRIDEPDPDKLFALQAKSVIAEAKRLKKDVFPEYELAILHSKMTPKKKDETMARFTAHEIDILVATSVVEVGVNVPNATVIMIEGAERFGLAQLHQLRGRVIRSNYQAYCFACAETRGERTVARLKALTTAKSGFELAEFDLKERGPGELKGGKQWGISDIGMEALTNLKLVEAARTEAIALVEKDEQISQHPLLKEELERRTAQLHFE